MVTVSDGCAIGRGEAVPYARYGETVEASLTDLRALPGPLLQIALVGPAAGGGSRNALDCALWDLEAKRESKRAWELAGLAAPRPVLTAYLSEPRHAVGDGSGGARRAGAQAPEAQARRRRRPRAHGRPCRRGTCPMRASSPTATRPGTAEDALAPFLELAARAGLRADRAADRGRPPMRPALYALSCAVANLRR